MYFFVYNIWVFKNVYKKVWVEEDLNVIEFLKLPIFLLIYTQIIVRVHEDLCIFFRVKKTIPMQVDGEPWMQAPAEVIRTHSFN